MVNLVTTKDFTHKMKQCNLLRTGTEFHNYHLTSSNLVLKLVNKILL